MTLNCISDGGAVGAYCAFDDRQKGMMMRCIDDSMKDCDLTTIFADSKCKHEKHLYDDTDIDASY